MPLKPRYKRRIFWTAISLVAAAILACVIVPQFINLNYLKPKIESAIAEQTGISAVINGNINFSLMGGAMIAAHNVTVQNGTIDDILFKIPIKYVFNLNNAPLSNTIYINGAEFNISEITPQQFTKEFIIRDTVVKFKNRRFEIISARLADGLLRGIVRSGQHKYEFDSKGDSFQIKNKNNNLTIQGRLYSDGTARGTMKIDTDKINDWFGFNEPYIDHAIKLSMGFDWDGNNGFKFSNINGDNFTGQIELFNDGSRDITLYSDRIVLNLDFLLNQTEMLKNTKFNLDLRGELRFGKKTFSRLKIDAIGHNDGIRINEIIADNIKITGGIITADGIINMPVDLQIDEFTNTPISCLFSGTPLVWKCSEFKMGKITGSLSMANNNLDAFIQSNDKTPNINDLKTYLARLGANRATVGFQFQDMGGTIYIDNKNTPPEYKFAKNKPLSWLGSDIYFLPESMHSAVGDFAWAGGIVTFKPHSGRWTISFNKGFFYISGKNIKEWFKSIDMQSVNDLEYSVSGNIDQDKISNLEIKIAGHTFQGSVNQNDITLATNILNIDSFINQQFIDRYEELQFLTNDPILMPFLIDSNVSLSADILIYSGNEYTNFVYSKRSGSQSFSVTDSLRGNLLANIIKEPKNKYSITLQLSKFVLADHVLSRATSINIMDTVVTAQATLYTSGQIAYDIWHNMHGDIDISFDGGILTGIGVDDFYANVNNITTLNAEYILSDALGNGSSMIKKLRIIGQYDGGVFTTTKPFILSMRHADAFGDLQINDGKVSMDLNLTLRGTSPAPSPIAMRILPNGIREFSLSQIMINFDPDFLRDFVSTHDKF